jgi:hypothetical protein
MIKKKIQKAQEIGISNANMAFDQAYAYDTLEDAIASFLDNVQDTLVEEGILTKETFAAAERAFDTRVAQLRG